MSVIKEILQKYVYQDWNIAIAERNDDLSLKNIRWMKHKYNDRWFADPFIIDDKHRGEYNRGIANWNTNPVALTSVVEQAQKRFQNQKETLHLMEYCRPSTGRGAR